MKFYVILAALALSSVMAMAGDKSAADACATKLATGPKQIYDLVAPEVKPDSDIKALLVSKLKPLVMAGKLDRASAKADGTTASNCLALLK